MSDVLSVADVRRTLGKAFNRAHYAREVIRVEKHGDPFVAVVSDVDGNNVMEIRELANLLDMDPSRFLARLKELVSEENELHQQFLDLVSGDLNDAASPPTDRKFAPA